jgi:hypothetical protein
MPGLTHNMKKLIQLNGMPKLLPKPMVLMMLLCKDLPQLSQIITTESMPGPILNTKKLILPNGKQRLLKLLKVDTTLPLKEDKEFVLFKPQMFQIIITE